MTTLRLAWLFARRGAADRSTIALPLVAFAVATTLLLVVAGGAQAFFSWTGELAPLYQGLTVIALAFLVSPLIALGGAAARLSARRRDDRLASLRLLGATPRTVTVLTVIESTTLAVAGALVGAVLSLGVAPLVGLIPFRGEPLGLSVLLAPGWTVLVVVVVGLLAALSASLGLRRVVLSPLGVRTRENAPKSHWLRIAIAAVALVILVVVMSVAGGAGGFLFVIGALAVAGGGTIAVLNLAGPWVLRRVAIRQARRATTVRRLLAARSILESPKAAWRQVSGVAMTSFMSVFAGVGLALIGLASDSDPQTMQLEADVRTGVLITIVASFLMVACSAGVSQAAGILDRRDLYVSLDRLGMPVAEMNAARTRAVLSPLRITTIGSAVVGGLVVFPLAGLSLIFAPTTLVVIAGCLAFGIALVWLALLATRPVLTRVLAEPSPSL